MNIVENFKLSRHYYFLTKYTHTLYLIILSLEKISSTTRYFLLPRELQRPSLLKFL